MPTGATPSPQLDLFVRQTPAYQKAFARDDVLRPILQGQSTLVQQRRATGIPYHRLWPDLRRFQHAGMVGLLERRPLPHARGKPPIDARVPREIQPQVVRLALAHPCTTRALARWGAPDTVVRDHGAVGLALQPCLAQLGIPWRPMPQGHPWQNLAESGFAVQRRLLEAYVLGCTARTLVYQQPAPCVPD
jgi:hypothetical protein